MNQEAIHLHDYAAPPRSDWNQPYVATAAVLLLVTVFSTVVVPWLADPSTSLSTKLQQLISTPLTMAASLGRRISTSSAGGSSSPGLPKVFGLDSSSLLRSPSIASPTRSLASLLRKGASNAPAGLGNWDNSCYQNSVIQGLASLPSLPPFLRDVVARRNATPRDSTNAALLEMVDRLYDEENNGLHLWLPTKLKSMSTWQQQDAQEYFSKILDQVDKEAAVAAKASSASPNRNVGFAVVLEDSDQNQETNLEDRVETSQPSPHALRNPLEGMLAQRVACTHCGYSDGMSLIPFNCLTVQLGEAWTYDIRECLDDYTKLEFIPGVQCPKCTLLRLQMQLTRLLESDSPNENLKNAMSTRLKVVEDALENEDFADATIVKKCGVKKENWTLSKKSRQAVIARAPQSLVIHVNRSCFNEITGAQTKNYADVTFPNTLDLGLWCVANQGGSDADENEESREGWSMNPVQSMLPSADNRNPEIYRLRAVVTHHGRHENGHYICYRMHPVKQTQLNDDDDRMSVDEDGSLPSERWWQLSDENVRPISAETVLAQGEVFMLFYEKGNHDATIPSSVQVQEDATDSQLVQTSTTTEVATEAMDIEPPSPASPAEELLVDEPSKSSLSSPIQIHTPAPSSDELAAPPPPQSTALDNSRNPSVSATSADFSNHSPSLALQPPTSTAEIPDTPTEEAETPLPITAPPAAQDSQQSQQQSQLVVMRTASIPTREGGEGMELDPGGFRMVAAT